MAALIFSRRKIFSKARLTNVVPAPEEPVTAMIGCGIDIAKLLIN
jgi:hypothetical protein